MRYHSKLAGDFARRYGEGFVLDVTNVPAVDDLARRLPKLDILVNCAGIILRNQREYEPDEFAKVIDVNLIGTMRMCLACKDALATSRGCVVNLASMLSFFGSAAAPAYSSSKGGVAQLTKRISRYRSLPMPSGVASWSSGRQWVAGVVPTTSQAQRYFSARPGRVRSRELCCPLMAAIQ